MAHREEPIRVQCGNPQCGMLYSIRPGHSDDCPRNCGARIIWTADIDESKERSPFECR